MVFRGLSHEFSLVVYKTLDRKLGQSKIIPTLYIWMCYPESFLLIENKLWSDNIDFST